MDLQPEPGDPGQRLAALAAEVDRDLALTQEDAGTVELDQSSVGRLSRMDALQRQAMAQAGIHWLTVRRRRILAAMDRVAAGTYGL